MVLDQTNPSPPEASESINETRLAAAMEEYLSALEAGRSIDRQEFLDKYSDLSPQLSTALESLDFVHSISPPHGDELGSQLQSSPEGRANIDGEELGDYRLIRELGRGGMGVVYEAEERTLGRRIALKVLPFAALLDQRRLARFQNEARAAAMVKHPHIVSVYSVGCQRGIYYYAMELIEGMSLAEVIDQRASPDADLSQTANHDTAPIAALSTQSTTDRKSFYRTVACLGIQAADALHYAHQEGIIHRDIKPSNLLLDKDGNLHVADFGLARIHAGDDLTLTGDMPGTLRYMSPEQVAGDQVVDQRGDIYSLGLSLYELVAGHPAFVSSSRQQIIKSICDEEPAPLHRLRQHVPHDLETIIHKAIAKEAEDRYQTAELLADDLRRFLDNRTIGARPATQVERVTRLAKRNPLVASLLAAVVLLLVALSVGSSSVAWKFAQHASRERIRVYARDMRLAKTYHCGDWISRQWFARGRFWRAISAR